MKKTIVIADDFENTRWIIDLTLNKLNAEILSAANGQEALNYFDGRPIDLLITDYNMPIMNGAELVENVKEKSKYSFIPIIVLTTERDPGKRAKIENLQVTAWVQKPFKQDHFLKIVERCLR